MTNSARPLKYGRHSLRSVRTGKERTFLPSTVRLAIFEVCLAIELDMQ